ncbi:YncE family protein [Natrinema longum]|uniref:YncE family protein n=1 Tax=Natrinema longum TaxID=370324 RepID=A0A8A2U7R3_9EURY|nr:YncE family protein [Natrinema longum]MBZ6493804.1 YncE family protein [Natrinema longum]QSW84859.1 YncE family protein [Natrinema longum]
MTFDTDSAAVATEGSSRTPTIVKNAASSHFSAVALSEGEVLAAVGEGRYPHTALFHPDAPVAYLLYIASAHLEVLDLERLETVQRVDRLGTMPVGSALGPGGDSLFVGTAVDLPTASDPGVIAFDIDEDGRLEPAGTRPLSRSSGMRIGPDDRLYVGQKIEDEVAVLGADPRLEVEARIPVGAEPHDLYVLDDDGLLVVNHAGGSSASFVDAAAERVRCTAETGTNPHGFAVADGPEYRYGLFPAREDDRVAVVDLEAAAAGEASSTETLLDVETTTGFAGVRPDGRYAIVDSYDEQFVTILNLTDLSVAGRVEIGGEPLHVVFGPDGEECYVGNMERTDLAVLDTRPLADDRPADVAVGRRIDGFGEKPSGIFRPEVDQ